MKSRGRVRLVPAGEFKARCLALLDRVERTREPVVVTKRGRPVAKVVPMERPSPSLAGSVTFQGDVLEPVLGDWDAER